jgi:hypothetical protein
MMGVRSFRPQGYNCRTGSRETQRLHRPCRTKKSLPPALKYLQQIRAYALQRTAGLWPPIKDAYALVYQAAHILASPASENPLLMEIETQSHATYNQETYKPEGQEKW